ncbi:MAG: CarD family transcriptional regulator [Deltaproteobacteria bacterium]|nr:CarD family transcriptional regulator [Deltaproteobacteria bacterium]
MFNIGDLAVYPAHGVGVIESIESKLISDSKQDFYIMRILDNGMIIMIPLDNVDSVGLRQVIDADQVPQIFAILKEREIVPDNQTWNRRYREYMDKIKTGSVFELAEVLRDLFILREDKELSFGERKMLDTARSLLVKEMSIAQDLDESQVHVWGEKEVIPRSTLVYSQSKTWSSGPGQSRRWRDCR